MRKTYDVHCAYGAASFENEHDAIKALWLLGKYHSMEIDMEAVKQGLEKEGYYMQIPLSVISSFIGVEAE